MQITYSQELNNLSVFEPVKLEGIGDFVTMLFSHIEDRTGSFGDFKVLCGVGFNDEAKTVDEAIKSIKPVNLIAKTVINNLYESGRIKSGGIYKIKFTAHKGTEYINKNGAKARTNSDHYQVVELSQIPDKLMKELDLALNDALVKSPKVEEVKEEPNEMASITASEPIDEGNSAPKPRL